MPTSFSSDGALGEGRLPVHAAVELERLGDLAADGEHRVQRARGLLEDHRDPVAPDVAHPVFRGLEQVFTLEQDLAPDDDAGRIGNEAKHRHGADALPARAFPDEPHALALVHVVGETVHRFDHTVIGVEIGAKVLDLENSLARAFCHLSCPSTAARGSRIVQRQQTVFQCILNFRDGGKRRDDAARIVVTSTAGPGAPRCAARSRWWWRIPSARCPPP